MYITADNDVHLAPLQAGDSLFMYHLLTSREWIENIGDRNIREVGDAENYIATLSSMAGSKMWCIRYKNISVGVISILQKDYLPYPDLGFAILKDFQRLGIAYSAASTLIEQYLATSGHATICAVTLLHNLPSRQLCGKLGFAFSGIIEGAGQELAFYVLHLDQKKELQWLPPQ